MAVRMRSGLLIAALFALRVVAKRRNAGSLRSAQTLARLLTLPIISCRHKKAPMLVEALMLEYKWR